ncbi:MAG: carboxypeptidase-like regulatory domain-containing protein [Defluviitaleaceae bacterium]|nr:carboxypeptidase-like regulatory domain-containing protein [Defluviitaleaceae bacterium]
MDKDKKHTTSASDSMSDQAVMKQILDQYAKETISEDRARHVHMPIIKMIEEGRFDKPRRVSWWPQTLASMAAVAAIAIVATFSHSDTTRYDNSHVGTLVEIPDAGIPLAGTPFEGHEPASFVIMPEDGFVFTLINEANQETFYLETVGSDGSYTFTGVPDGNYRLMALAPLAAQSVEVGRLSVLNERVEMLP